MANTRTSPPSRPIRTARPTPPLFVPVVVTSVVGAVGFYFAQELFGMQRASLDRLGQAVVRQGGYPIDLAPLVGWGVHLTVALGYTTLFALAAWTMFGSLPRRWRWLATGLLAGLMAVAASLLAPIASTTVVDLVLGGRLPSRFPAIAVDANWGRELWVHVMFFGIAWLGTVVALDADAEMVPPR